MKPAAGAFPWRASADSRRFVDAGGAPVFYHADTAWQIFHRLTLAEAEEYLAARKAQGFNAVQVQLTGFLGQADREGRPPFGPRHDLSAPDEGFFRHVEAVMDRAEKLGLLLAVAPFWSGCCGEGWAGKDKEGRPKPLNAHGPEGCRGVGRWLGRRFGKRPNLWWILGGDNDPDNARAEIRQLALGLQDACAPHQLRTYHAASSHSSTDVWPGGEEWLGASMVYTYFRGFDKAWNKAQPDVYEVCWAERKKAPARPFFLGESTYEGEHGDWGSALQVRKQAYWAALGGAAGHAYGSVCWNLPADWRERVKMPGAASLAHLRVLLESRPWQTLGPDADGRLIVSGAGPAAKNDLATAAVASDGAFALCYLPSRRRVECDPAPLRAARVRAWWFDPRTGAATAAGEFDAGKASRAFTPPGDGDWVLVLDDAARGFPPPGRTG